MTYYDQARKLVGEDFARTCAKARARAKNENEVFTVCISECETVNYATRSWFESRSKDYLATSAVLLNIHPDGREQWERVPSEWENAKPPHPSDT